MTLPPARSSSPQRTVHPAGVPLSPLAAERDWLTRRDGLGQWRR